MTDDDTTRPVRDLAQDAWNLRAGSALVWRDVDDPPAGGDHVYLGSWWDRDDSPGEDRPRYLDLGPIAGAGDYVGGSYHRSNCRSLARDYPDTFVEVDADYGYESLLLPFDAEIDTHLFDILRELADEYPVYDESDMSELEHDIMLEDWESFGQADFEDALRDALYGDNDGWELTPDVSDQIDWFWHRMSDGDGSEWECETATSGHFRGLETLAQEYADEIVAAWNGTPPVSEDQLTLSV